VPSARRRDSTAKSWVAGGICMVTQKRVKANTSGMMVITELYWEKEMNEKKPRYMTQGRLLKESSNSRPVQGSIIRA